VINFKASSALLEATLAASEEKRVFDEETLTGYWKFPVIKGLNYQTTTHPSGITDETGAFKCQPGEVVAFSIENLSLTQVDCQAILQTKMTKSVSLNVASTGDGFKDWQDGIRIVNTTAPTTTFLACISISLVRRKRLTT
jgi:outer membrane protein assembly factor BamB